MRRGIRLIAMDEFDAYLYSIDDDLDLPEEANSDNDVLDNINEEQSLTDTSVVFVPASSPAREKQSGHEVESSTTLEPIDRCHKVFTEKFGFSEYKGKQKEIIQAAMTGIDIFVLAPTGMGKSLCFQVPAIAEDSGVSIIVSPLLALMKNQVTNLRSKGINAVSLTSETTKKDKIEIMRDLSSKQPRVRLFYTTPEKLCNQDLISILAVVYSNRRLSRLVIDEAHCISEWGHDFREEYRKLGSFRERFPDIPIMALTATATKTVQRDIIRSLKIAEDNLFTAVHPFNRANLYYEVRYKSAPESIALKQDILKFIKALHRRRNRPSSGIIYCRKRGMCDELSNYLCKEGLNARPYHRGISSKTLSKTLKEWEVGGAGEGGIDVVCATIAFGMGIDKSDVRYIIHYDLPKSMEGYYQETGRAGRDGLPSRCILYYSREDTLHLQKLIASSLARRKDAACSRKEPQPSQRSIDSLGVLTSFAENVSTCRHVSICRYFGEIIDTTDDDVMESICDKMCDVCKYPDRTQQEKTVLSEEDYAAQVVSNAIWNAGYEDDEDTDGQKPQLQEFVPVSVASKSTNALDTGQRTLWDCIKPAPVQGFKRPSSHGDALVSSNAKRTKVEHTKDNCTTINTAPVRSGSTTRTGASMPPPLVTRPYSSASNLTKPFKTPFKTPFKVPSEENSHIAKAHPDDRDRKANERTHHPSVATQHVRKEEDGVDDIEIIEVKREPSPEISPDETIDVDVEFPEIKMEVEASFSLKVPLATRMLVLDTLRKSFHRVFVLSADTPWSILAGAPTDEENRMLVLAEAAKRLEHAIHMMCATPSGYETRVAQKRRAIASLGVGKGKGRVENDRNGTWEDEDVSEVMEVLRGVVERLCKRRPDTQ